MARSVILLIFLLASFSCSAQSGAPEFEAANRLYETGKFKEAADAYERLLAGGQASPAVYFNLGNARFRANQPGQAILAYRRAQRLSPRDPDIRANLTFARDQVRGPRWQPPKAEQILARLTLNEWTGVATGVVWLFFAVITAGQIRPPWKSGLRNWTWAGGAAAMLALALLATAWNVHRAHPVVVVTTADAVVRNGPLEESQAAFSAANGAELLLLDKKDKWLMVTAGAGRTGWIPAEKVQPD